MKHYATLAAVVSGLLAGSQACDSCFGPINKVEHVRHAKRMQPDAFNATYGPTRGSLEWGQLNFLHTVRNAFRTVTQKKHACFGHSLADTPS